jgi:hypothetical protein
LFREAPDHLLLDEAAHQSRAIVTYNARDFAHLHRVALAAGRLGWAPEAGSGLSASS